MGKNRGKRGKKGGRNPPSSALAPPVSPSGPSVSASEPPVSASGPPVSASAPPVSASEPPASSSGPPVSASGPPVSASGPPVSASAPQVPASGPPASSSSAPPASALAQLAGVTPQELFRRFSVQYNSMVILEEDMSLHRALPKGVEQMSIVEMEGKEMARHDLEEKMSELAYSLNGEGIVLRLTSPDDFKVLEELKRRNGENWQVKLLGPQRGFKEMSSKFMSAKARGLGMSIEFE